MLHGTQDDAAWKISKNGFGTVASLDQGYYGKGIYFTSSLEYSLQYSPEDKVVIIAITLPGNSFPVIEHPFLIDNITGTVLLDSNKKRIINPEGYLGHSCKSGYQSHYSIVTRRNLNEAYPLSLNVNFDEKEHADELVVFQDLQALPLFIVYCQ